MKLSGKEAERGSITVFFILLVAALIGAVGLSIYIGQVIERRIRSQISADEAAMVSAGQSAQGLNMIAANNLAIASSIHIAGALNITAMYFGVVRAAEYSVEDAATDIISLLATGTDHIQDDIFSKFGVIAGKMLDGASGMTELNSYINKAWLLTAPLRSIETVRLNLPGAMALPLQRTATTPNFVMRYEGLSQVSPGDTICHAIRSGEDLGDDNDNVVRWLEGPLKASPLSGLDALVAPLAAVMDVANKVLAIRFGFVDCGSGFTGPLMGLFTAIANGIPGPGAAALAAKEAPLVQEALGQDFPSITHCCCAGLAGIPLRPLCKAVEIFKETAIDAVFNAFLAVKATTGDKVYVSHVLAAQTLYDMAKRNRQLPPGGKHECLPYPGGCFDPGTELDDKDDGDGWSVKAWSCPLRPEIGPEAFSPLPFACINNVWKGSFDSKCAGWVAFENATGNSSINIVNWGSPGQADEFVKPHEIIPFGLLSLVPGDGATTAQKATIKKAQADIGRQIAQNGVATGGMLGGAPRPERRKSLGFLVIAADPNDATRANAAFERSSDFATLVMNVLRTTADFSSTSPCPSAAHDQFEVAGSAKRPCDETPVVAFGVDLKASPPADPASSVDHPALASTLTGGVQPALAGGWLASSWARMQVVGAQAEVAYEPGPGDPSGGNGANGLVAAPPPPTSRLFWPAWRPRPVRFSMFRDMLEYARSSGGGPANGTLDVAAQLLQ